MTSARAPASRRSRTTWSSDRQLPLARDLTAVEALQRLQASLPERGVCLHLAEVRGPVMDRLKDTDLPEKLARKPFLSLHEAVGVLVP